MKRKRKIINPNRGFVKQLKRYESELMAMKRNRKDEGRREGKHVDFMNEGRKSEK